MSSANRIAYEASIKAAAIAALASRASNLTSRHGIVTAATSIGFLPGFPANYATYAAAVAAANAQKLVDDATIEQTKQGAEQAAKDLLRSQGELP